MSGASQRERKAYEGGRAGRMRPLDEYAFLRIGEIVRVDNERNLVDIQWWRDATRKNI